MAVRNMPQNIEAEQNVLGACFLADTALQKVCESLHKEIFFKEANSIIFDAIKSLVDQKLPLDITVLTEQLIKQNVLDKIGGVDYLNEIIDMVPSAANVDYYIDIIVEKYTRRKLIQVNTEIMSKAYIEETDVLDLMDDAEKRVLSIQKLRKSSEFQSISDVLAKAQNEIETLSKRKGDITGLASGFIDLDKLTSGFHANELIIIAARPAMGKTAFALNVAVNCAKNTSKAVAIFNLEMGASQLAMRMIASAGRVDGNKIKNGYLSHDDWKSINEGVAQLASTNIYIDDTAGITIGEIRAKCRRLANSKEGLGLVVIDYLTLIQGSNKYQGNRQQEVSEISRSLKTMAMELEVPVIALAQLSREVEKRENKKPIMSDLRESGSIEQDADIVSFLYREDYYKKNEEDEEVYSDNSKVELIIAKHRNGPVDTVNLLFQKSTSTFVSLQS